MLRDGIARASHILKYEGLRKLLSKIPLVLRRSLLLLSPNEARLVFGVLKSMEITGTMIDVGAGTGTTLAPFSASGWEVHAFEPDNNNRAKLNAIYPNRARLKVDPRAVADADRLGVPFFTSNVSIGVSALTPFLSNHVRSGIVDTISLMSYVKEANLDSIQFLKIDAEGSDLRVLQGTPWEIAPPLVVMCEFDDRKTMALGYQWTDLTALLISRGYKIIVSEWKPIQQYGGETEWQGYRIFPCELTSNRSWGNLLATRSPNVLNELAAAFSRFGSYRKPLLEKFRRLD